MEPLSEETYTKHALMGLAYEVRTMRDTPADKLPLAKALKYIEDEIHRIRRGDVGESDLIG